jgi:hypothetical protein
MEKRFRALRIIATIYKVVAWIILIFGILIGFLYLAVFLIGGASTVRQGYYGLVGGGLIGIVFATLIMLYAAILFLVLYGAGEAIFLALAVEENTRETTLLLHSLVLSSSPQQFRT